MKRGRFSEEQIIGVLKEGEAGAKVSELCRRHWISDATFYTWRSGSETTSVAAVKELADTALAQLFAVR
jgi:putative transposase